MRANKHNEYAQNIYRPRKVLWFIVIAIIILFCTLIGFAIIKLFVKKPQKQQGQILKRSISSMEDKYRSSNVSVLLDKQNGWSVAEDNGNYAIKSLSNICSFTINTSKSVKDAIINKGTLDSSVNAELKSINDKLANQTLVINDTSSAFFDSNRGKIEFLQKDAEYQSSESGQHVVKVYGQWIGEYQVIIVNDCVKADFNNGQAPIEELLKTIKININ